MPLYHKPISIPVVCSDVEFLVYHNNKITYKAKLHLQTDKNVCEMVPLFHLTSFIYFVKLLVGAW